MRPELTPFARRLVPARPDIAAAELAGRVESAAFVAGVPRVVVAPVLDLALSPAPGYGLATQLLHGEPFTVYEARADGLSWGQSGWDGYVGFVATAGLGAPVAGNVARRRVTALASHIYSLPEVKAPVLATLPFGAEVAGSAGPPGFFQLASGGFVPEAHLAARPGDAVDAARRFLGVPYLWGGRTAQGIDCSGLVQCALTAAGVAEVPRDSDMQAALLGAPLPVDTTPVRGDLVFWQGHVGIVTGADGVIHANAHHMAVAEEPLSTALARIAALGGGPVTGLRRPPRPSLRSGTDGTDPART